MYLSISVCFASVYVSARNDTKNLPIFFFENVNVEFVVEEEHGEHDVDAEHPGVE